MGINFLLSGPVRPLTMCGATSLTKPMIPETAMAPPVCNEEKKQCVPGHSDVHVQGEGIRGESLVQLPDPRG